MSRLRGAATAIADPPARSDGPVAVVAVQSSPVRVSWLPGLLHVWTMLPVLAAALGSALQPLEPIDYWWGVRLGDLIRATGTIPTDDPLVYTPLRGPIVDGQWLAKVLLSFTHQVGSVELALALRSIIAMSIALLLVRACRAAGAGPRASALASSLAAILFVPGLAVRPQLFAIVPFIVVWQAALHPPRRVVALLGAAGLVAFWANVHGSSHPDRSPARGGPH